MMRLRFPLLLLPLGLSILLVACGGEKPGSTAGPADTDLIYGDDFSSESAGPWLLEADESGSTVLQDGRLLIEVSQADTLQYTALDEPTFADFDLTVDTELIAGDREATYGLLFRMADPENFYRFELTGDGRYIVESHESDGSWRRLVDGWQKSDAIMTGPGAINRLRVVATGPAMAFYVNDALLEEIQDGRYLAGQVALDAGAFGNQRTFVAFDNLTVRAP
jgi:hypothetical protein